MISNSFVFSSNASHVFEVLFLASFDFSKWPALINFHRPILLCAPAEFADATDPDNSDAEQEPHQSWPA
jgi:hypothetical protein